jgi:hypothetical protein
MSRSTDVLISRSYLFVAQISRDPVKMDPEGQVDIIFYRHYCNIWENRLSASGRYGLEWEGRDSSGASVSSENHLYSFRAGDFTSARKMTLPE